MQLRHEWKHEISYLDMLLIRQRLKAVAKVDKNAVDGKYQIRSLYFDTLSDKALREKLNGVSQREKFRIRYYNRDTSLIHLEKKVKLAGLGTKLSANLTKEQAKAIVDGNLDWMKVSKQELIKEFYVKMKNEGLQAKTIVDYEREPFVFPAGNVRVTLDYNIRTGLGCTDFLNPDCITIPAGESPIILEVKWDEFLPSVIRDAIQLENRQTEAFSKYAVCRMYD